VVKELAGANASRIAAVKFVPLVWASLWRHKAESALTLLALCVGFMLCGTMIAVNAAYEQAIDDARMDRLVVACAFDCGSIPLGYRDQLARIPHVTAAGAVAWIGELGQDTQHHGMTVTFVDDGIRSAWPELPMTPADWRALDVTPSGIFLTRKAAARRTVRVGDTVNMYSGPDGTVDGTGIYHFTVLGFIPDPPGWRSAGGGPSEIIIGNLRYARNWGPREERNFATILRLAVDRPENARGVCREIAAWYTNASPALYCVPARADVQEAAEANINMRQISLGIGAAGLFMILFLCANGIAESVRERLSEFGVLKAMGYQDGHIAILVILEAAIPTLLAAFIGSLLAWGVDALVAHLALTGVVEMPEMRGSLMALGWALAAALLVALVSAVAPLYRLRHSDVAAVVAGR
jgi:putative ABC transport system permease protein